MSTKKPEFTRPMADVCLEPVIVAGKETGKVAVMVQDDEGEFQCQTFQPSDYCLIKNVDVLEGIEAVMENSPFKWERKGHIWNGKAMSLFYKSDLIRNIAETGNGLYLGLIVDNSYDGSAKFKISFVAYFHPDDGRLVVPMVLKSFVIVYIDGKREFDMIGVIDYIEDGYTHLEGLTNLIIGNFIDAPLSANVAVSAAKTLPIPGFNYCAAIQDLPKDPTLWDFIMALAFQTTHRMKGASALRSGEAVGNFFTTLLGMQ